MDRSRFALLVCLLGGFLLSGCPGEANLDLSGEAETDSSGSCAAGVSCSTPPANACVDSITLGVYAPIGVCSNGRCTYASSTLPCSGSCENGQCKDDPCAGITCATPPAASCADASTATIMANVGTCQSGVCSYASTMMPCPYGCEDGKCRSQCQPLVVASTNPPNNGVYCGLASAKPVYINFNKTVSAVAGPQIMITNLTTAEVVIGPSASVADAQLAIQFTHDRLDGNKYLVVVPAGLLVDSCGQKNGAYALIFTARK